jgi:hypothetical protein
MATASQPKPKKRKVNMPKIASAVPNATAKLINIIPALIAQGTSGSLLGDTIIMPAGSLIPGSTILGQLLCQYVDPGALNPLLTLSLQVNGSPGLSTTFSGGGTQLAAFYITGVMRNDGQTLLLYIITLRGANISSIVTGTVATVIGQNVVLDVVASLAAAAGASFISNLATITINNEVV